MLCHNHTASGTSFTTKTSDSKFYIKEILILPSTTQIDSPLKRNRVTAEYMQDTSNSNYYTPSTVIKYSAFLSCATVQKCAMCSGKIYVVSNIPYHPCKNSSPNRHHGIHAPFESFYLPFYLTRMKHNIQTLVAKSLSLRC